MEQSALEKMINMGLSKFSEELNSKVLKSIASRSPPIVDVLGDCSEIVPEIFTILVNTHDQVVHLNNAFKDYSFICESEFDPVKQALKNCSTEIFATKENYERIKSISSNCQNYSNNILNNVARARHLDDHQRGESSEIVEINRRQALVELSRISFTPVTESNFEELKAEINSIREKQLYNKSSRESHWSPGAHY